MKDRLTTDKRKIFARESLTLNSMTKDELRKHYNEIFDRLQEYEVAEEQGQLISPPCKVGDVVWLIGNMKIYTKEVCCSRKVTSVQMLRTGELIMHFKDGCFGADAIGKHVFFTREEAQAKLKGK